MRPEVVTEQDGRQRFEGDLEQRMLAVMESVSCVCEEIFKDEHEWVTQLTMSEWEDRILADLDCNMDIPCVVQWALLWFTAPSRSNLKYEDDGVHDEMYHEVTDTAIRWACGQRYGGYFTPRRALIGAVMTVMGRLAEQHWDLDQELRGWEPRDLKDVGDGPADVRIWLNWFLFLRSYSPGRMRRVSLSSSSSREGTRPVSTIKRRSAVLKKAMAD